MSLERLQQQLAELSPTLSPLFSIEFGDAVIGVDRDQMHATASELFELGFERLSMVTAVDRGESFVMVYRIKSRSLSAALYLKTKVPREDPWIDSVFDIWPAADWQEREVFDLFGVEFRNHPDMRRILLPDDFDGHPLRKDYENPRMIRRPDYI